MSIFSAIRTVIRVIGFIDSALDECEREKAKEQAKLAEARKKMSEIYQKASNSAGPLSK